MVYAVKSSEVETELNFLIYGENTNTIAIPALYCLILYSVVIAYQHNLQFSIMSVDSWKTQYNNSSRSFFTTVVSCVNKPAT